MGLVLTRREDESVVITAGDDQVTVRVASIRGNRTRLKIDAPRHVTIHRLEVQQAIEASQEEPAA